MATTTATHMSCGDDDDDDDDDAQGGARPLKIIIRVVMTPFTTVIVMMPEG